MTRFFTALICAMSIAGVTQAALGAGSTTSVVEVERRLTEFIPSQMLCVSPMETNEATRAQQVLLYEKASEEVIQYAHDLYSTLLKFGRCAVPSASEWPEMRTDVLEMIEKGQWAHGPATVGVMQYGFVSVEYEILELTQLELRAVLVNKVRCLLEAWPQTTLCQRIKMPPPYKKTMYVMAVRLLSPPPKDIISQVHE